MKIDLSQFTIEEIVELKEELVNKIYSYSDGYEYICNVRSYGRNWKEHITNTYILQELCYQYSGDDGIVDVYSTNPDLSQISNYGDLMYIKSVDDYEKWKEYEYLSRIIPELEKEWGEWDNRDNIPFSERRTYFAPIYSKDDIEKMKKQLENFDMSFTVPQNYSQSEVI